MLIFLKDQCKIVLNPSFQNIWSLGDALHIPKNKTHESKVFSTEMVQAFEVHSCESKSWSVKNSIPACLPGCPWTEHTNVTSWSCEVGERAAAIRGPEKCEESAVSRSRLHVQDTMCGLFAWASHRRTYQDLMVGLIRSLWLWEEPSSTLSVDTRSRASAKAITMPTYTPRYTPRMSSNQQELLPWIAQETFMHIYSFMPSAIHASVT